MKGGLEMNQSFRPPVNRPFPGRPGPNPNRFGGGFLGPFILGGITGGLVAPFFYNRPVYYPPYGPYPPYYRPY